MTPYATFGYFGVLLYAIAPLLLPGVATRWSRLWLLGATALMLLVQYWTPAELWPGQLVQPLWLVVAYGAFQWSVAQGFLVFRRYQSARWPFYAAVALALLPLAVAKYLPVLAPDTAIGFLGISYVTFRSLDVIFLIQDRLVQSLPTAQYLAYLFFFPTVSSGPIDRYRRFEQDWKRQRTRAEVWADVDSAVHHIFTGLLYKFILAYLVQRHWLAPLTGRGLLDTVSYMYGYSAYLFFDFAGYSAFAVGVSHLFGVHTPENFNRPFLARDIREFWNRWHISLSTWFRDHVYLRFVLTATKRRWFKDRYTASTLGFLLLFGLMGLWHGPHLHYLLYGLYHAGLMIGYDRFTRWNKERGVWGTGRAWDVAALLLTFHAVCFGFLLFSGRLF